MSCLSDRFFLLSRSILFHMFHFLSGGWYIRLDDCSTLSIWRWNTDVSNWSVLFGLVSPPKSISKDKGISPWGLSLINTIAHPFWAVEKAHDLINMITEPENANRNHGDQELVEGWTGRCEPHSPVRLRRR